MYNFAREQLGGIREQEVGSVIGVVTPTSGSQNIGGCLSWTEITQNGGQVNQNPDGTVSVYVKNNFGNLVPLPLSKFCCESLTNPKAERQTRYFFDINAQKCRWSPSLIEGDCVIKDPFKIVLNPVGNNGSIFSIQANETCQLTIDFDYLFKVKCDMLNNILISPFVSTPKSEAEIKVINQAQEELSVLIRECNTITNSIETTTASLADIPYVVFCDVVKRPTTIISLNPEMIGKATKTAFGKSNFGNLAPFSLYLAVASGKYCLTEPAGLSAWATILGPIKHQEFLSCGSSGTPTFTCQDVQRLIDQNTTNLLSTGPKLFQDSCNTNFGDRADTQKKLNKLINGQKVCEVKILSAQIKLDELTASPTISPCVSPIDFFESFDISMTLDMVVTNSLGVPELVTVGEYPLFPSTTNTSPIGSNNLYSYLLTHPNNSGFYVYGNPIGETTEVPLVFNFGPKSEVDQQTFLCNNVGGSLLTDLKDESGIADTTTFNNSIPANSFNSEWLHYHSLITDPAILSLITNKPIKISIRINHACGDFCVLVDEISLGKVCTKVVENNIFVTQSPGFNLDRIRDNKKSWLANDTRVNRPFVISNNLGGNSIRATNYDVNDERLVINSKEIDLDISLASAIETDVWCYLVDNPCLLTGITMCNPCGENCGDKTFQDSFCYDFMDDYLYEFMDGTANTLTKSIMECCGDNMIDFKSLMTQSLSDVTTVEDFEYFMQSELVDTKNRQTISGYSTLRALYDRYMNSGLYCGTNSSRFDYVTMEQFSGLIDNYWVDLVEQVIPATTIWGSVKIYSNTIFDQQKYKYKAYSTLFCGNPFEGQTVLSPINGTSGVCSSVEVVSSPLLSSSSQEVRMKNQTTICNSICVAQMNSGSEFIGTIKIIGPPPLDCSINNGVVIECPMQISVNVSNAPIISLNIVAGGGGYTYQWSNGDTGATTTIISGDYSVIVTDKNCCSAAAEFVVELIPEPIPQLSACWYNMPEKPSYVIDSVYCDYLDYTAITFNISSMIVNSVELITDMGYTTTITSANTNIVSATNGITTCQGNNVTYSNFVELVNDMFTDLGLINYKAQLSLVGKPTSEYGSPAGFYIIRPDTDTFTINTSGLNYTETGVFSSYMNTPNTYYEFICGDFLIEDGLVTE